MLLLASDAAGKKRPSRKERRERRVMQQQKQQQEENKGLHQPSSTLVVGAWHVLLTTYNMPYTNDVVELTSRRI